MAKLTYKERTSLPKSSFVFKKGGPKDKGKYPIPDASHARNALARVSQFGSPSQKAAVKAKVKAKFPTIKQYKNKV